MTEKHRFTLSGSRREHHQWEVSLFACVAKKCDVLIWTQHVQMRRMSTASSTSSECCTKLAARESKNWPEKLRLCSRKRIARGAYSVIS